MGEGLPKHDGMPRVERKMKMGRTTQDVRTASEVTAEMKARQDQEQAQNEARVEAQDEQRLEAAEEWVSNLTSGNAFHEGEYVQTLDGKGAIIDKGGQYVHLDGAKGRTLSLEELTPKPEPKPPTKSVWQKLAGFFNRAS